MCELWLVGHRTMSYDLRHGSKVDRLLIESSLRTVIVLIAKYNGSSRAYRKNYCTLAVRFGWIGFGFGFDHLWSNLTIS